jgi:cell division protein FtsZ
VGLEDVDLASNLIAAEAAPDANVIWGVNFDNELEDEMRITIIATGFASNKPEPKKPEAVKPEPARPERRPEGPAKREKPKASADEELDRLMKEFDTPKKKKISR